jgi:hypothetical protein
MEHFLKNFLHLKKQKSGEIKPQQSIPEVWISSPECDVPMLYFTGAENSTLGMLCLPYGLKQL